MIHQKHGKHRADRKEPGNPDDAGQGTGQGTGQGQVSEVASFDPAGPSPEAPGDATAGSPEAESGRPDEGTAGPDAPPRHGRPEESNESSR